MLMKMYKPDCEDLHPYVAIYRTLSSFLSTDTKVLKEKDTSHFIPSTITPMLLLLMHEQVKRCLEVFRKYMGYELLTFFGGLVGERVKSWNTQMSASDFLMNGTIKLFKCTLGFGRASLLNSVLPFCSDRIPGKQAVQPENTIYKATKGCL
jgi:hypothetical protein